MRRALPLFLILLAAGSARAAREVLDVVRLREGAAAFIAGEYGMACKRLLPLAGEKVLLRNRDYALYYLAESEALLGVERRDGTLLRAAAGHFQAVQKIGGSRFAVLARARAADCLWHLGETEEEAQEKARNAYQDLLKTAGLDKHPELDLAVPRFRLAELEEQKGLGMHREARADFRRVYVEHPQHPLAEAALARLRGIDGDTKIEASERLARARSLTNSRRWPEALDELRRVPPDVAPALRDEVDYWMGTTFYKMRHAYEEAAKKLLGVAAHFKGERQAEAMFHGARALSRADRDDEAIPAYLAMLRAHPGSRYAAEALFLSGWLEYNRGRYREAIPALEQTIRRFSGPFAEEARWYQGLSRYLLKDYAGALGNFQWLGKNSGAHGEKGRYWSARTLLLLDKKAEAEPILRAVAEARPLSYYGLLSRVRLQELGVTVKPFAAAAGSFTALPLDKIDSKVAESPEVARVDELLQAELPIAAGHELRRVEGTLLSRFGAPRALPVLVDRYLRGQNYQRPYLLGESYGAAALHRDPHKVPQARPFWELVYPLAYKDLVERYAASGFNPPRYLYTIMQKESAYNPHDVSYADAIGLLQMIPPTSRLVARHIERPYTDDVLYDPEGNIQFGAWYIGRLLRKFRGQIALGAGAFNAGPKAMVRWLKLHGERPLDEFIELCAYTQTREYMKKILDIYAHYVYLWDKEEYLPDLHIDADYRTDDGIDY